jgi:hypothetical protein
MIDEVQAASIRHVDITQDGVELPAGSQRGCFLAGSRAGDAKAVEGESRLQHQPDGSFVIGNEDMWL